MDSALMEQVQRTGQEQVLTFWDKLGEAQRTALEADLAGVDWAALPDWVRQYVLRKPAVEVPPDLEPPFVYPAQPADAEQQALYARATEKGWELLRQGQVAAFTVAGGQGTRLGYDGPKGSYPISPVRQKPLFQLFAEKLIRWGQRCGRPIPWYLMTSEVNDQPTRAFFAEHDHFGMDPAEVTFFRQGMMPAFDLEGKMLLADKHRLALSPDGHGGSLKALHQSGALADMAARGVLEISYFQVDNPLVSVISPLFLGLHHLTGSEMSCRSLQKRDPFEKLGNFCVSAGKLHVIEYSDLDPELAERRRPDGRLLFEAGSPAIHVLQRAFVERLNAHGFALPFHRADKKVPHVDLATGEPVTPTEPNGVKLETFVFDALPLAKQTLILAAERESEFAPVKNAEGSDSPAVTRAMMIAEHARWLEANGCTLPRDAAGQPDLNLEISPLAALDAEDLARLPGLGDLALIKGAGVYIDAP